MSYLNIKQEDLVNLKYALNVEFIRSNKADSYVSTTIIGCNTRKYHGLLIVPFSDNTKHVLLSEIEETVIQKGSSFRLGIRKYAGGKYDPHGHRYITEFETKPIPSRTYRVGGVILKKEILLTEKEERFLIRYTILEAHSPTVLRLQPFLAFRNIHALSKANMDADTKTSAVQNGITAKLYQNYPPLYLQISRKNEFVSAPDWYYNVEYQKEQERGYEFNEDLFVPGFFDIKVKEGDTIVFSAGTSEINTKTLLQKFNDEISKIVPRDNFKNNLINSSQQFFIHKKDGIRIKSGFHWYDSDFRFTLLSICGLSLVNDNTEFFETVLDTFLKDFNKEKYDLSLDIPLLLTNIIYKYYNYSKKSDTIKKKYFKNINSIVQDIIEKKYRAELHENGLLYIPENGKPETWMNEVVDGKRVTNRYGYIVEINAFWYNALMIIQETGTKKQKEQTKAITNKIDISFEKNFINKKDNCLFDFVNHEANQDIRPNQIFAVALEYSPLNLENKRMVLEKVKNHLLTDKGLRSLSPKNHKYKGIHIGNIHERQQSKHQGTIHPWLIGYFAEAWLRVYGEIGIEFIKEIFNKFEVEMNNHGIGTVSETFDGNPPYEARDAVSFAPSVAEVLRISMLVERFENNINNKKAL